MPILIIKVKYGKKDYEIIIQKEITIEEIKIRCQKEFNFPEKDINNINLWFIDEDNDKNLISHINELMTFAKEIDINKFLINLNVDINIKKINDIENSNKIEKDYILNNNNNKVIFKNKNIYEKRIKEEKENIIRKIKKENELLKKLINYYQEKIKQIIKYYEEALNEKYIKPLNLINKQDIKKEEIINENKNIFEDKIKNQNQKEQINILKNDKIDERENKTKGESNQITEKENTQIIKTEIEILYDMEFINNKCQKCYKYSEKKIYKCIFCDTYYLCDNCLK